MQAAKVLDLKEASEAKYRLEPDSASRVRGNGRAIAVAKFRELADKLESGEIDGARVQWLDTHGGLLDDDGKAISGLEFVTRTAWREDGSGTVALKALTIEETR
jgi:hypothetical protein